MNLIYWNCGVKTLLMQLRKERLEKKQACRDLSPDLCDTGKCGALTNWVSRPLRSVIYPGEMRLCNLFNIFIFKTRDKQSDVNRLHYCPCTMRRKGWGRKGI